MSLLLTLLFLYNRGYDFRGLLVLEEPGSRITNKKARNIFKISQITTSRDLAHLKTLGLFVSHGKGRSIYYTRAN